MDEDEKEPPLPLTESLQRLSLSLLHEEQQRPPNDPTTAGKPQQTLNKPPSNSAQPSRSPARAINGHAKQASPTISRQTSAKGDASGLQQKPPFTPSKSTSRQTSIQMNSTMPALDADMQATPIQIADTLPVTANTVAAEHFRKELALHANDGMSSSETAVIIHDACYGHRFSRLKTPKSVLNVIVERPERIQACMRGIAAAYVKLGGRHAGAANAPHSQREPSRDVPFGIKRSSRVIPLTAGVVTNVHGTRWMQELTTMCYAAGSKVAAGAKELARPDTAGAIPKQKLHEGDLYLCKDSLDAMQGALGGVLDGVDAVFGCSTGGSSAMSAKTRRAFVCVRPPGHHCSADLPSGFCWLNNVHVGIEHAAQSYGLTHAAIIDFDLHHGDGSQAITWERNTKAAKVPKNMPQSKKSSIGYFSLHDINSYPCEYGNVEKVQAASLCLEGAHNQTIWNVHLQPWKTEEEFWALYQSRYLVLLAKARTYLRAQTERIRSSTPGVRPKSAIFISAGFDASEWEGQGMQRHKVNVPTEFYARFTKDIIRIAADEGTAAEGRVVSVLEGGYSDRALMSGVFSHVTGLVNSPQPGSDGANGDAASSKPKHETYDRRWWSVEALDELDAQSQPATLAQPRTAKTTQPSNYASLTESFTAKVVDPAKLHRSMSGSAPPSEAIRAPTPPPPDVNWSTATHELSKLLIPSDRQINSCKFEDLNEPKLKQPKRERHSAGSVPIEPAGVIMETRGRKAKVPSYPAPNATNGIDLPIRTASSSSRRRTISSLPLTHDINAVPAVPPLAPSAQPVATIPQETLSGRTSRRTSPRKGTASPKLHRTRRASGAQTNLIQKDPNVKAPPIPKVPSKFSQDKIEGSTFNREGTADSSASGGDMDKLTKSVKKITLNMSRDGSQATTPSSSESAPTKGRAKTVTPRTTAPKAATITPKASATVRGVKSTKATASSDASVRAPAAAASTVGGTGTAPGIGTAVPAPIPEASTLLPSNPGPTAAMPALSTNIVPPQGTAMRATSSAEAAQSLNPAGPAYPPGIVTAADTSGESQITSRASTQESFETAATQSSENFISYDPNSDFPHQQPQPRTANPDSLTWLAPNTNTPQQTPAKRKENLPNFSATGNIPFQQVSYPQSPTKKQQDATKGEQSLWDVPATPRG